MTNIPIIPDHPTRFERRHAMVADRARIRCPNELQRQNNAEVTAKLPAILPASRGFAATGVHALGGES